jgi:ubiquinone/menaquinone biosynthesis C-methylase UbiE
MAVEITVLIIGTVVLILLLLRLVRKSTSLPAPAYMGRLLDSGFRHFFQSPGTVVERSGVAPGMTIMELGCGSGAYTTHMARAIGKEGKLFAVDIQPAMLRQLKRKLSREENGDIRNVELREASAYELPFGDESFDMAFMVTVLMEIPDKRRSLREVKRVLKPGGVLAVTEFFPDPDYPCRSTVTKLGMRAGFTLDGSQGNFWNYTVRFRKPVSAQSED